MPPVYSNMRSLVRSYATFLPGPSAIREPVLQIRTHFGSDQPAGLELVNVGLGPAVVVRSSVTVGGHELDQYGTATVDVLCAAMDPRPHGSTFESGDVLATDYVELLLWLLHPGTDRTEPASVLNERLAIVLQYESIYGGEKLRVDWPNPNRVLIRRSTSEPTSPGPVSPESS